MLAFSGFKKCCTLAFTGSGYCQKRVCFWDQKLPLIGDLWLSFIFFYFFWWFFYLQVIQFMNPTSHGSQITGATLKYYLNSCRIFSRATKSKERQLNHLVFSMSTLCHITISMQKGNRNILHNRKISVWGSACAHLGRGRQNELANIFDIIFSSVLFLSFSSLWLWVWYFAWASKSKWVRVRKRYLKVNLHVGGKYVCSCWWGDTEVKGSLEFLWLHAQWPSVLWSCWWCLQL